MSENALPSASAPGKVLICGGYLIVEPGNEGLSIGVNARFTTRVTALKQQQQQQDGGAVNVTVHSPQFNATFQYTLSASADYQSVTIAQKSGRESVFLANGLLFSFANALLQQHETKKNKKKDDDGDGGGGGFDAQAHFQQNVSIKMTLLAANDFYSQRNYLAAQGKSVTVATLKAVPAHTPLVGEVSKTGLGSSAALTSSLVACVHALYGVKDVETIHRVAQVAHSVAQGKIGSGFDVFTAVYGTCIYKRFDPALVTAVMASGEVSKGVASLPPLAQCLESTTGWVDHRSFHGLPKQVYLLLADIHQGGSATPGMVAKIMAWKKENENKEGNAWAAQRQANKSYLASLEKLAATSRSENEKEAKAYHSIVEKLSHAPVAQWTKFCDSEDPSEKEIAELFTTVSQKAGRARDLLRAIGECAEVEVEPPLLTPLLDATLQLDGVLAAGCPGAGGYDAIFALVVGEEQCTAVENFWEGCKDLSVCPLLVREDPSGIVFDQTS